MAIYIRLGDEVREAVLGGLVEGFRRLERGEGRFLGRLMEDMDGPVVIDQLGERPDAGVNLLLMGYGFDSLLGCPVRLEGKKMGFLAFLRSSARTWKDEEKDITGMLVRALEIEEERLACEERE